MGNEHDEVVVQEVGLRDGLQRLSSIMPTGDKKHWIDTAYAAGVRHMELASFGVLATLPQLIDGAELVAHARRHDGLVITAVATDEAGARAALACGVHRIVAPISASALHSLSNVRRTPREMIEEFRKIRELRDRTDGTRSTKVVAALATALGCAYKGAVPHVEVCDVALQAVDAGCDELALADTTGLATPDKVVDLIEILRPFCSDKLKTAHFHNTCGLGLANVVAALQCGIHSFDSSLAGLGGADGPKSASGNVVTEDLVFMLESMGYRTGIDLRKLMGCRTVLNRTFGQRALEGFVARSGVPDEFQLQPMLWSSTHA
ncbi:hydroxymethylglutaryl-CoA lyase [Paraburkholderia panacisoli]|uniref:Hydroxymethylglutaryl-CoA lyase n=1 Tax=Paraburkholderia panacisoli TaxID=2603818 RepID=A0A5B0GCE7_9BURK|nr:hydroxymethylglutaryl-CoA lyase [Paraburkholderia panacisoli]KAA1000966.1 hydroxymethylglutaryl-CoA lyase [Paraburkholderia panacisoli]